MTSDVWFVFKIQFSPVKRETRALVSTSFLMPVPSPPQPRANSPPSMVSTSVSLEAIQPTLSLQLYCLFTLHCTLWILLSLVSSFSTTGVIINELFLHDSPDVNNPKPDQLILHQGEKFTSLSTRKH